mgnify:FL=1|tara:strand:+ start:256 stop:621 length:366 start_codon:yes stop_codon:yes gene_type:complete
MSQLHNDIITMGVKIKWEDANFLWNNNPYLWDEVEIVEKVVSKGGGSVYDVWERVKKLTPKEKKKFIQVIVKVKGNMEYSSPHIYTMKKEVQNNLDITVEDVKLVAEAVLGIKLQIENIHV